MWLEAYGDALYRYALFRLRDHARAEDAVQETFLAALKGYRDFAGRAAVRTWLFGILRHKIVDTIRIDSRKVSTDAVEAKTENLDDFFDEHGHYRFPPQAWQGNPRKDFERGEFWECFTQCLARLPKRTADVFSLRELDGLDREEICKILGLSSTNYWVILHRARLGLRECLERNWFSSGKE